MAADGLDNIASYRTNDTKDTLFPRVELYEYRRKEGLVAMCTANKMPEYCDRSDYAWH